MDKAGKALRSLTRGIMRNPPQFALCESMYHRTRARMVTIRRASVLLLRLQPPGIGIICLQSPDMANGQMKSQAIDMGPQRSPDIGSNQLQSPGMDQCQFAGTEMDHLHSPSKPVNQLQGPEIALDHAIRRSCSVLLQCVPPCFLYFSI